MDNIFLGYHLEVWQRDQEYWYSVSFWLPDQSYHAQSEHVKTLDDVFAAAQTFRAERQKEYDDAA